MAPPDKAAGGGIKTSTLELDEAGKLADLIKSGFNSIAFLLSSSTRSSLCKLMDFEMGLSSTLCISSGLNFLISGYIET